MARVFTLSSSSAGNSVFVGDGQQAFLVDCGISFKQICASLEQYEIGISDISSLLITHEHFDHIKGIVTLCKKTDIEVFASQKTCESIVLHHPELEGRLTPIQKDKEYIVDKMSFTAFSVSHDADDAVGYKIKTADNRIVVYSTDTGVVSDELFENLSGADLNIIEANYDEGMLACNLSYTFLLKQRISGEFGHLSNNQCADTVARLISRSNRRFLLAHLSEQNNTPEVAFETVNLKLVQNGLVRGVDFELDVAPRFENSRMLIF